MTQYTVEERGAEVCVVLAGDLTAALVPELQAALKRHLERGPTEIVFDLGNTRVLDSSGVGLLIAASNTMGRRQGRVRVGQVSRDIYRLLQSMRLVSRLNVSAGNEPNREA